ncbi:MAG TPA: aspartate 1-decarboxylase [Mariprofundaceae bacterium]|nr:aspartate 1-decarboxylase [Mariprofundaceae bacterium]
MKLTMLKSKLHRVTVTHAELDYEGSCAIDQDLMEAAGILPFEQLHIYNIANGERFTTYAITAPRGSGTIGVNGAAAHKASRGDLLIICTYAEMEAAEAAHFKPMLVYVDAANRITHTSHGRLAAVG